MKDLRDRLAELPEEKRAEIQRLLLERARARRDDPESAASGTARDGDPDGLRPGLAGPGLVEPSHAQERLWFLDRLDPGRATYHIPAAVHLTGDVGVPAFTDAWNEVRRRHEPLRTDFPSTGGRPLQRIHPAGSARLPLTDLTGLAAGDRHAELDRLTDAVILKPFRIDESPPVRAHWVRTTPTEHAFLLCVHHLVADGASVGILVDELSSLYGTSRSGKPSPLDEPEVRYADWVVRERHSPDTRFDASRTYWREHLAGLPPLLPLPTDRPRPAVGRHRGSIHAARLDAATVDSLDSLARSRSTTFFAALAAAFTAVLQHWSGARDVPVGVPVAGRRGRRVRHLVGLFVDTVVLRPDLSGDPTFAEFVDRLRAETLGAFSHQDLPFERLVEDLGVERSRSHAPIFQALLTLNEAADVGGGLPGVDLTLEEPHTGTAKFDLTLTVVRKPDGGAKLTLEVDRDLFDPTTAQRIVERFSRIARSVAAEPNRPVHRLPYLSDAERHLLTREWSAPARGPQAAPFLLHERFFAQAEATSQAVAVVDGDRRRTYGELAREARTLARRLQSLGAEPDTLVGLYAGRSLDTVVGLVGILASGAAYLPLDPDYPAERTAFVLEDAQVDVVVTTREHAVSVPDGLRTVLLDDPEQEPVLPAQSTLPDAVVPDHLAYVIYTSGSTGRPKGVAVTHGNASRLFAATGFDFGPEDVWTLFHSPAFDFSVWEIWGALLHGGRLVVVPYLTSRSPADTLRLLAAEGVTVLSQTPSAFLQLQEAALGDDTPTLSLRNVIFGGEALQPAALRPWIDRYGAHGPNGPRLINMYGITETTVHVTRRTIRRDDVTATWSPLGRPLADLTLHLVIPDDVRLPPLGAVGEIGVGGAGLARGYLDRPARTAERFVPHPWGPPGARLYRSGDLARYRADGDLEYLGRLDHQVQLRGFRVELGEIEAALEACPGVAEAVVVPADAGHGNGRVESLAAWVRGNADAAALRKRLAERLPEYMVPSRLFLRAELPLTPTGKIDRRALREAAREARPEAATGAAYVAPDTPAAQVMAGIWSDVLDVERVGLHDDFFALGGHSLLATRVVSRLEEALGVAVPVAALFEAPTVAGLTDRLETHAAAPPRLPSVTRHDLDGPQPLSASQLREWFLDRMSPGNPAYHVTASLRFDGVVSPTGLGQAFDEVVRRHETLRTVFPLSGDGEPRQEIRPAAPVPPLVVDLSGLPVTHRETAARELARKVVERPFDLAAGPVVRWTVLPLAPADAVVTWVIHHVAADGWSLGVLTRELSTLYDAYAAGKPASLDDPPVRYVDYARTQRDFLDGPDGEALAAAWRERLTPLPEPLELPADRPAGRRADSAARAGAVPFRLGRDTTAKLHEAARRHGASPFMLLAAGLSALLGRLADTSDLVLGTFVAGRERPEIEPLVGFFVNTLPLRVDLGGDPTFGALVDRVRETTLAAYGLQSMPFERILETLDVDRSVQRTPVFQALLVLQNHPLGAVHLGDASARRFGDGQPDTGLDLTWWAEETDGELTGLLEYAADRFDRTTVRRWRDAWLRLLRDGLAEPGDPVARLSWLSPAERHQVVREWSPGDALTEPETPSDGFLARFRSRVGDTPDRVALVDAATGTCWTYGGLAARVRELAAYLASQGAGPEDRVALRMERSPELPAAMLAALWVGAAWVPLDPTWPERRTSQMARDAGAAVTLDGPVPARGSHVEAVPELPGSAAYVVYTSGSTGRPKGVVVSRRALSWYAAAAIRHYALRPEDRVLQFSSPSFDASIEEIFPTLAQGATLVLRDDASASSGAAFYDLCRDHGVTVVSTPTAFWHELADQDLPAAGFPPSLRTVILGGERVRPERIAQWRATVGDRTALLNTYGPTESTVVATLEPIRATPADGRDVPIGRAVPGARNHVLDGRMEPVPPGVVGELMLGGPGTARGYLGHPAATAAAFVPDPFSAAPGARLYATGDRARRLADGRIEFRGRADAQVKIRGFRVEPGEIEDVLGRHPAVADVAVVARTDRDTPFLAAFYEPSPSDEPPVPESALRDYLGERLPVWMVPRVFTALDDLPKTPAGKIDRRRLREIPLQAGDRPEVADYVAPRTPTEEVLAEIWAECLEVDRVGVLDDFFALGGHSLLLTRITARIREALDVDVPLTTFFEAPTIVALAREIETTTRPPLPPVERLPRDGRDFPTAFAQERLWFLSQLDPDSGSYHVPRVLMMDGNLSATALDGAYQEVIRRQEVLRTTFPEKAGKPWQRIHPPLETYVVPRVDLSGLDDGPRRAEARALMDRLSRRTFDLERGPLLRVYLLRMEPRLHRLLQNEHHMVHDGWTEGVLLENVMVLYRAFALGEPSPLEELPFHFADFAAWQRQWLTGDVLDEQVEFWKSHLEGAPALLELPTDRPRPKVLSSRGDARNFRISGELSRAVSALGRRQGTTLFMTMLAAFEAVLVRWSGQSDLVVGTGVANRRHRETEKLVGMIINTLALRTDASGDPLFDELLARVRAVCLDAYAHEDLPFEKVVEVMAPERALSHHPLFQVEFAFYNAPRSLVELPGIQLRDEAVHNRSTKWDLLYIVTPPAGDREFTVAHVEWSTDLFDACTVERLFRHFEHVMESVTEDPSVPLSELPLLSPGERHQVSREWAGSAVPEATFRLHDRFFQRASETPDAVALVDGERHVTYGDVALRARRLAARLRASGVGTDRVVGLYGGRSAETVTALVGVLTSGAAYLPLDPAYPADRIRLALGDSAASVVVSTAPHPVDPDIVEAAHTWLDFAGLEAFGDPALAASEASGESDAAAYVIYTSGSTGRPKGVVVSHANASRLFSTTEADFDFDSRDVWTLFHSTAFDFSVWEIWGALLHGARLVVVPYFTSRSPKETHALLAAEGVTVLNQTPSAFLQLQEAQALTEDTLDALRWVVFGGEALDPAAPAPWFQRYGDGSDDTGPTLVNMYGITETTVHATYRPLSKRDAAEPMGSRIGRPLGDLSIRVRHPISLEPAPMGVAGEVLVGGAGPARGYLHRPALTAERFVPDPDGAPGARLYRSGDLARFRAPTGDLEYLGRIDHQVQLRGFRVELGEIETALASHPDVAAAVVVPVGDAASVDRVAAWVRPADGAAPEVGSLREHVTRSLPSYMVPALYFVRDAFPTTPSGKVDRKALRRESTDAGRTARSRARYVEPETPTGRTLAALWEDVLDVPRVGLTDDFFALGGHSLLATQVLHRIEEEFGVEVPLRRLFESPTLESLEMAVTEAQAARTDEADLLAMLARLEETA